jgi:methionyl-tRNA formyltransferase
VPADRLASSLAPPDDIGSTQPKPHLLKIWKVEIVECSGRPGKILSADKTGIVVGCGEGALRISELQREGGRRMNAAEFLAGHALKVGEKFEG